MPPDGDDLAVAAAVELAERRVGLAAELLAHARQRMLGDVQAEHLLLEPQQLAALELLGRDTADGASRASRMLGRRPPPSARSKIEPWPARRSACCLAPHCSAWSSTSSMPRREPGRAPHLTSASTTRRFETDGSMRSAKSQIDSNGPVLARGDDRAAGRLADALHGVQAEADLAADDGEVDLRLVHVGRQHLDAELVAGVDVERHAVLRVHHRADQRRHVLAGWLARSQAVW